MLKVAMIGLGGVMLALVFRQQKSEYALYLSMACAVMIIFFSVSRLAVVIETFRRMEENLHIDSAMIGIVIKMIGITYVAEFASGISKDAGFTALANQIEMFAKLSVMAVSVPVLSVLVETVEGLFAS